MAASNFQGPRCLDDFKSLISVHLLTSILTAQVLPSGGPVAMIWGLVISFVGVLCIAASLAEICAVLPTSGGPYHWSYVLAPPGWERVISYSNGWINTAGWVCLTGKSQVAESPFRAWARSTSDLLFLSTSLSSNFSFFFLPYFWIVSATTSSLGASFITGIIALLHSNYEVQSWHTFLVYIGFAILGWLVNVFLVKILDPINRAALIWSLAGACLICITCLACASPDYQSGKLVFGTFINSTGWPNGVVSEWREEGKDTDLFVLLFLTLETPFLFLRLSFWAYSNREWIRDR